MKAKLLSILFVAGIIFMMSSCSADSAEDNSVTAKSQVAVKFEYSVSELAAMKLINDYRVSIGLNALEPINYVSVKSEEHDQYMITKNVVSHDGFVSRSEDIVKVVGAKNVGENIAYNYNSPESAVNAWLKSASHKDNIEGNFTHFGIAIRENATTGKKYYTNIFVRI
ncbi:MAG: CAP domain-containing protein [Flavobacteriaceae bacterium]|jgi:uncharacterized protein YkwD|uniref:CAP domain-containing protein n=1 Tax=Flavobacterium kayseriense TaxID=2764714 RepID=A0ABR7JAI0_9FLAO|nr:CAP domain-containing protein [Flavobacterium kayseriense]MBC5842393.1 CAP domain-containing protein [Flavobacterium kayseriense]MBC5848923.1 CAP domain-containing protein [Flavobacterium kayseriense]MBU0940609.1 CAP domain-containing protein [Bacteroidota bacterium]MBX9886806.1 CAP domain-containing protein [Flavobacteriaceae bacterium]